MNKNEITKRAFILACRYIQTHLPAEIDMNDEAQVMACIGCGTYEAGWTQWARYFLDKVEEEVKE